ncbi:hypothetical protein FGB62_10g214 [Gracilaria domingensis]|nr:hypothetical protein FGB62_10g214 [Gracilaria domingensis]
MQTPLERFLLETREELVRVWKDYLAKVNKRFDALESGSRLTPIPSPIRGKDFVREPNVSAPMRATIDFQNVSIPEGREKYIQFPTGATDKKLKTDAKDALESIMIEKLGENYGMVFWATASKTSHFAQCEAVIRMASRSNNFIVYRQSSKLWCIWWLAEQKMKSKRRPSKVKTGFSDAVQSVAAEPSISATPHSSPGTHDIAICGSGELGASRLHVPPPENVDQSRRTYDGGEEERIHRNDAPLQRHDVGAAGESSFPVRRIQSSSPLYPGNRNGREQGSSVIANDVGRKRNIASVSLSVPQGRGEERNECFHARDLPFPVHDNAATRRTRSPPISLTAPQDRVQREKAPSADLENRMARNSHVTTNNAVMQGRTPSATLEPYRMKRTTRNEPSNRNEECITSNHVPARKRISDTTYTQPQSKEPCYEEEDHILPTRSPTEMNATKAKTTAATRTCPLPTTNIITCRSIKICLPLRGPKSTMSREIRERGTAIHVSSNESGAFERRDVRSLSNATPSACQRAADNMGTTVTAPCEGFRPSGLLINARGRNNQKEFTAKGVRQRESTRADMVPKRGGRVEKTIVGSSVQDRGRSRGRRRGGSRARGRGRGRGRGLKTAIVRSHGKGLGGRQRT